MTWSCGIGRSGKKKWDASGISPIYFDRDKAPIVWNDKNGFALPAR